MLKHLYIKSYALIDELDIEFHSGFSTLTGETGAGKSIILGALSLLLGGRADSKAIKAKTAVVEKKDDGVAWGAVYWQYWQDVDKVKALLSGCSHVVDVHHVHVWAISTTDVALTAHVVIDDVQAMDAARKVLKQHLKEMGICHSTLEMETPETHCRNQSCG